MAVKPFSMALLGWLFIGWLFRPYLPADDRQLHHRADPARRGALHRDGVRVVEPDQGRSAVHALQVAVNDAIMIVAFAPIVALLLGLSSITVPWETLILSVVLYIVVPVIVAQVLRRQVLASGGPAALDRLLARIQPLSLVALLATLVLLFAFQGKQICQSASNVSAPIDSQERTYDLALNADIDFSLRRRWRVEAVSAARRLRVA